MRFNISIGWWKTHSSQSNIEGLKEILSKRMIGQLNKLKNSKKTDLVQIPRETCEIHLKRIRIKIRQTIPQRL